jgi:hypothetical protein
MKNSFRISQNRFLSIQLKKALFRSFVEAKKQKTDIIDSQLLIYGILKSSPNLTTQTLKNVYQLNKTKNPIDKIIKNLEYNFENRYKSINLNVCKPNFSRPVRRLLFFLIRSNKNEKYSVITTFDVLNYLLKHKYVKNVLNESLNEK